MKNAKKKAFTPTTRIISFILTLLLIFYILPLSALAEADFDTGGTSTSSAETSDSDVVYDTPKEVYELTELREENVKHFRLEDGSYIAASYDAPVHYLDADGVWQDIDNRLFDISGEYSTSDARIKFAKKITGNETLFTLHDGNAKITMGLIGAIKKTVGVVTSDHSTDEAEETKLGKLQNLENLTSSILYENILDGVDLEYVVRSLGIKENLIVKERKSDYSYAFSLKLNNLTANLAEDGSVKIENSDGEQSYVIPAPVVFDSEYSYAPSEAAYYTLTDDGDGKYTLSVTVSSEWMNAEERKFPVTIDPAISPTSSQTVDLYVATNSTTTTSTSSYNHLYVGTSYRSYWKSLMPSIPVGSYIAQGTVSMYSYSGSGVYVGAYQVTSAWDSSLTAATFEDGVNPTNSSAPLDYVHVTSNGWHEWDITEAVKHWRTVGGSQIYGIVFMPVSNTTASSTIYFHSTEYGSLKPSLSVSYVSMLGVEDYYPQYPHSAGLAGEGSINLATGNLTFAIDTVSTTDYLMPFMPKLVYNSVLNNDLYGVTQAPYDNMSAYAPYGFKTNLQETLVKKTYLTNTGASSHYYVYADADGTEHNFLPDPNQSILYRDEDGLRLELRVYEDMALLTDTSKSVRAFEKSSSSSGDYEYWYLISVTDKNGNILEITNDGFYRPTKVSMKPNIYASMEMLTFSMISVDYFTKKVYAVFNPTSKEGVIFKFSSTYNGSISTASNTWQYLREVIYVKGTSSATAADIETFYTSGSSANVSRLASATYEYDSYGNLIQVKDSVSGRYLKYEYSSANSGTVSKITEYGRGGAVGQSVVFTYGNGYTDVRSSGSDDVYGNSDDVITRYIFDSYGRAASYYSMSADNREVYGAVSGKYESQENVKNNIKESASIGGSNTNFILNGGFELSTSTTSFTYWSLTSNVSRSSNVGSQEDGAYAACFNVKAGVTDKVYQYVFLDEGDYTLSLEYASINTSGVSAVVKAQSLTNSAYTVTKAIPLDRKNESTCDGISLTIPVNSSVNGGDRYLISIEVTGGSSVTSGASVSIDNVMIERGITVGPYNLVNMGHFESSNITSSGSVSTQPGELWKTQGGSNASITANSSPFDNTATVENSVTSRRYIKQRIYEASADLLYLFDYSSQEFSPNTNVDYLVSGYGKATAPLSSCSDFSIKVNVYYYQGAGESDIIITHTFPFQDIANQWQFVSGSFSGKDTQTQTGEHNYTCIRYIDVICEYSKNYAGIAYFDNVSVTECPVGSKAKYEYDDFGNVIEKKDYFFPTYYEYDAENNLIRAASNNGELTDYSYDDVGNLTEEIQYTFTSGTNETLYPHDATDPDSLIAKTEKSSTSYTYNKYGQVLTKTTQNASESQKTVTTNTYVTTSGSKIFGALKSVSDGMGNKTEYYYDSTNGRLLATANVYTSEGSVYTYDSLGRLTGVKPARYSSSTSYTTETNTERVNYTYNSYGYLSTIATAETTYTLTYDVFGNTDVIKAGSNTLANYDYNSYNGKLKKITYGNGFVEEYVYNELEFLSEIWYTYNGTKSKAYEYTYTEDGQLSRVNDISANKSTVYLYDKNGRLTEIVEYSGTDNYNDFSVNNEYDSDGRISVAYLQLGYLVGSTPATQTEEYSYSYDSQNLLTSMSVGANNAFYNSSYTYDALNRLTKKTNGYSNTFTSEQSYTYRTNGTNTSLEVSTYTSKVGSNTTSYTYTYDKNGYIVKEIVNGKEIRYVYDNLGQLVRIDNAIIDYTFVYAYDNAGNIISEKIYGIAAEGSSPSVLFVTHTYGYSTGTWGDLLTSYDGQSITYDAIGNPLSYYNGSIFTWKGRQLATATKGGVSYSFTYNDEGIRTSKTVGGVKHTYYVNGSQILAEEWSNKLLVFIYDESGSPVGMRYRTTSYAEDVWDVYFFEKNLQGDIIAVCNSSGTRLAYYKYDDAWGYHSATYSHGGGSTGAQYNPFRYRGYYYDADLGLYYLNSRYYDANTGRFISADGYVSTGQDILGNNMFAYCGNNPINRIDPTGQFWSEIWEFAKTAVAEFGKAMGVMSPAYAGCGGAALGDGPLPFGDIVGLAVAALLTVGAIGYGIYQAAQVPSSSIPKADTKEKNITASLPSSTVIYRYGGTNPGNLTPSQRDVDLYPMTGKGLSFSTVPKPGAAMTTIEALNATGVVYAVCDGADHVSVHPIGGTLEDWHNAGSSSVWTKAVKSVVVKWGGGN